MKKRIFTIFALFTVSTLTLAGCTKDEKKSAAEATEIVQTESGAQKENGETISQLSGTIETINDFMFILTDDGDASYAFTFTEKPEGLEEVAAGDRVIVKYTGEISEIDPFRGEVLSVEKE